MGVKRFTKYPMTDTISLRKQVAAKLIAENSGTTLPNLTIR